MPQRLRAALLLLSLSWLGACQQPAQAPAVPGAETPAQAVLGLTRRLHDNDLAGYARAAVPPALHARLEAGWRDGRTRWPLDELPFGRRLPTMLRTLAAPDAEIRLQTVFDRQFAGADAELHGAAAALGLFGTQYVLQEGGYGEDERQHYVQVIAAVTGWSRQAPLGDRPRARRALVGLIQAARTTGLVSDADFRNAGMEEGLRRMGPFAAAFKQALRGYGLDLDADLAGMRAVLLQQTGDQARVRMRYRLGGHDVDAVVPLRRIDGRWYLADQLRRAEAALQPPAHAGVTGAGRARR